MRVLPSSIVVPVDDALSVRCFAWGAFGARRDYFCIALCARLEPMNDGFSVALKAWTDLDFALSAGHADKTCARSISAALWTSNWCIGFFDHHLWRPGIRHVCARENGQNDGTVKRMARVHEIEQ